MQLSFKNNNTPLHKLFALAFCLALSTSQSSLAQPIEENGGEMQNGFRNGQNWRQKIMNLPPEKREMFMQRIRERKGQQQNFPNQQFMQEMPDSPGIPGGERFSGGQGFPGGERFPGGQGFPGASGRPGMQVPQEGEQPFANRRGTMRKRPGAGGRQGFGFGGRALDLSQLNLSEKQKNDILTLRSKHSEQSKSIQKNLREKRMELRNLLFSPDLNRKALQDKRNELRGLQNKMDDIMMDDFLGIRSVLNEEQIKRLAETNLPNAKKKTSAEIQPKNE